MSQPESPRQEGADEEVSALIETLHETGQRLEDLTAGEVDAVADRGGRPFLLRRAQDQLRVREAHRQAAILDALPAHVALLDNQGLVVSVNDAWLRFDLGRPAVQAPGHAIGSNYLEICDHAQGEGSTEAHQAAEGIRSVLDGGATAFSIEYPCHSRTQQRWFLLTVAPLARDPPNGAVVMHLDVTARKRDEAELLRFGTAMKATAERVRRLNRVYAVLSGINALIVRVRDREELYREACRIAVEDGNFGMAWIGAFDPATEDVTPVAWAGENAEEITRAKSSSREDTPRGKGAVGRAIRERRPVFNNDVAAHGFGGPRRTAILKLGYRSQITLPVFEAQAVAGTLTMYAREADFFDEEEVRLLTGLAGDISFALENISRQGKLDRLARIRAVSTEINAAIIRIHDREALLRETCHIAVEHGKFELVWIALVDQEKQRIKPIAWAGFFAESAHLITWATLAIPGVTLAEVIRTREVAVRNDIGAEGIPGSLRQEAMKHGYRSTVCVPFMVGGSVAAAMILFAAGQGFFDEEEVALLNEVAANVSFALEHIEKEEKLARVSRIQAVTGSINALIVRVHDRRELFNEACRIAVEEGQFALAWIGLLDPVTQDVTPAASAGEGAEVITRTRSSARDDTPLGQGAVGRAIRARAPVFNNDIVAHGLGGPRREKILRLGFQSLIALPLFEGTSVTGTLAIYAREPDFFDAEELTLLTELAGDISFGLGNIGRQHKLDKLARIRAVSSGINAAIIRIHDREALLRETCRVAVEHGKFELVWIGFIDQEAQRVEPVSWAGFSAETAHELTWAKLSAPGITLAEVIRTRKVAVRNDIDARNTAGTLRPEAVKKGARASVAVPFMVDDRVVAAMILYAPESGFFDAEELELLSEVAADVSFALQAIEKQEKLEYLSYYDVLTGLPNRALFVDRLSQQMRSRGGEQQMVAVILLDLERFRNINESVGHRGGDEVLVSIAQRLGAAFHGKDYLARISSNGFGVIVRGVKDAAAVVYLVENEIFSRFTQPFVVSEREIRVAVKAGIAMFPVDGGNADILFRNAESALKRVQASSNRYLFYAADMNAQAADAIALEMRLRTAIDARQFVLHYQPKIELATGRVCGLEALIRWNDPAIGLVSPDQFIPNLEETGMILEVGAWALRQAVADHAQWAAQGLEPPRVAVNVSQIQLRHAGFVAMVADVTRAYVDGAAGLVLEITESLFMENFDDCVVKLTAIRDMGVEIAVDDFGTGYSSLSYISRLPVDSLKIDRSFVLKMASESDSMSIVSMVITLAHALNLKVVAEGVETEEQSNTLKLLRCDEAQGYLFARPVAAQGIEALLRERAGKPNRTRRELRPRALM
jgi:diguanylate cyclase (GGDEF)-like protein